jgi:ankyrin repeat protein
MNVYNCIALLSIVASSAVCMEQSIIKYDKCMPDGVRELLDRSKKFKGKCSDCCGGPGLNEEKKWRALICATYYEDSPSVKNLLEDYALSESALEYTRKDSMMCLPEHVYTFLRLHVLPLTVARYTQNQEIIKLLEQKSTLEDKMCPLSALAVYMGDVNLLDQCIKNNDFNSLYEDKLGGSLLQLAVRNGDENMVTRLLQISDIIANINRSHYAAPVMFIAAQRGFLNIAKQLYGTGADLYAKYYSPKLWGFSLPVCSAAQNKHSDMVAFLCQQSEDMVNACDMDGNSALHIATHNGDVKTVKVLLAIKNIDIEKKNAYGERPLDIAKQHSLQVECMLWRWLDKNKFHYS